MLVIKVVDEDIADKVDTKYIADQFVHVHDADIIFICTSEGGEEDDWVDESGVRQIIIHLPYKDVKRTADIRPLMLAKARERLGLVA